MNLIGRRCVVMGGGEVALRKVTMLLKAQTFVDCYSLEFCSEFQALAKAGKIQINLEPFHEIQLDGACLVIAATDDEAVNEEVSLIIGDGLR